MYDYLRRVDIYELIPLVLGCLYLFTAGIIFSIFPDAVREWEAGLVDRLGKVGSWLGRRFYHNEDSFVRSSGYVTFIQVVGYVFMLLAGIMTGFLVTYILRT